MYFTQCIFLLLLINIFFINIKYIFLFLFQIRSFNAPELCLDAISADKLDLKECVDDDENQVILL